MTVVEVIMMVVVKVVMGVVGKWHNQIWQVVTTTWFSRMRK